MVAKDTEIEVSKRVACLNGWRVQEMDEGSNTEIRFHRGGCLIQAFYFAENGAALRAYVYPEFHPPNPNYKKPLKPYKNGAASKLKDLIETLITPLVDPSESTVVV